MNDEETPNKSVSRRGLLAVLGAGAATTSGIAYAAVNRSADTEQRVSETDSEQPIPEGELSDVQNIEDFGATPGTDTEAVARENMEAIRSAAHEAGEHGTVYVPEGDYFFGTADQGFALRFGQREPKGVSFVGAGPRQSRLVFTSTVDPGSNYRAIRYESENLDGESVNHGEVTARGICFDGNYRELDMDGGKTIWGYYAYGDGHFTLDNVWIRGWWANGSKFDGPSATIRCSTFEENGIGFAQDRDNPLASHHIVANPPDGSFILVEDCEFLRCSGSVINRRGNNGDVTLRRAWIRGAGHSCIKMSETTGTTRVENTYFEPRTDWIVQNISEAFGSRGRWFLHRLRGDKTPVIILENVVARNMSMNFILCYKTTSLDFRGDQIAVHNAAINEGRRSAIRADNGIDVDIGSISVHGTNGDVFDTPDATGRVENLLRNGNEGLGDIGNLSMEDNPQSGYLQPDVAARNEVGIHSVLGAYRQ